MGGRAASPVGMRTAARRPTRTSSPKATLTAITMTTTVAGLTCRSMTTGRRQSVAWRPVQARTGSRSLARLVARLLVVRWSARQAAPAQQAALGRRAARRRSGLRQRPLRRAARKGCLSHHARRQRLTTSTRIAAGSLTTASCATRCVSTAWMWTRKGHARWWRCTTTDPTASWTCRSLRSW